MKKLISRILGSVMLIGAILFISFAISHPEMSFPWSNVFSYILYAIYLVIMLILLIAPTRREKRYITKDL